MERLLVYILLILLLTSCGHLGNWQTFSPQGLPQQNEKYTDLIFVDSLTGYLGGSRMTLLNGENNQFSTKSVLYKTRDQGKSWLKIPLNYEGSVDKIFAFNDTLIVLLQDATSDSVHILQSDNNGKNWKSLFTNSKNIYIREIKFKNINNAFIIADDRKKLSVIKLNSNKTDTILHLPNNYYHFKIIKNHIFSLILEQTTANSIGVLITDIESGKNKKILFKKPYYITSLTSTKDDLYLSANDSTTGRIVRVNEQGIQILNLGEYSDYQTNQVFVYKNTLVVIVNQKKDVSFLGVTHKLLISKDNGLTWKMQEPPESMILKPATMYKNNFFMTYCGAGDIQVLKGEPLFPPTHQ